ncbi:uncharacterized protein [Mytilus edulis]|uniref:uncharacterized protein n=1 Tax=Mytilus edulis TaxID=6550 RepID=UPI0039EE1F5D
MEKGPESLEELNFEKVIEEMKQKFPEVLQILICIMLPKEKRSSEIALANILPRLAMIYGMMMQSRYHELSRIQRVIAMCLADNICDQSVYDRLNRLGVSSSYCVAVDTITKLGKRYTGFLVKFLEEGKFIRLIGDNLNFTVGTSHETKSQHKHMVHMFTSLALISDHHFLTKPVEPEISLNHLSIDNILLSKKEYKMIRHEVIGLIIDTAVKFLPNISFLKESKSLEYISAKTEVIPLPCLPYNENKYQDDVKILAWYQQLLDTIKKEAGADADLKFVIGGDQLTRERLSEAMLLRFGNIDPQDQFSHIRRCVAECFHLGMNYLEKVVFGELWNVEGVVEKGTLRGECERLSRKTVDPKVMKAYEADKDFVDNYLSANIIEALMSYFGMDNQNDFPTQNLPPTSFDDDRAREIWTYNTLEQFVDTFVFPSWSGHVQDDQVLEDPTEINEYIELLLDNGQTIHIPVAVSEYTFQKLKPDKVKYYAHYSLEVGLIFRYFLNLCKEPVREQFLPLLKMMMVQLRGHSICAKYHKEILRMLIQQYSVMGLQEACQVFCASFVNLHGRKDGNVPADLVQEWNVKESKKHIKHMFSNKENSTIEHKTSALPSIHKIASNFDTEVGTLVRAKRHKDKSYDDEVCVIMEDLREILPFTHQEGRSYETFKNIPKSLCEKVDGLKLQKWFKKHKNSFPL